MAGVDFCRLPRVPANTYRARDDGHDLHDRHGDRHANRLRWKESGEMTVMKVETPRIGEFGGGKGANGFVSQ